MGDFKEGSNMGDSESDKRKSQIYAEYFQSLELWLKYVRAYKESNCYFPELPYFMMTPQMNGFPSFESPGYNIGAPPVCPFTRSFGPGLYPTHQQQPGQPEDGVQYVIPPLWKRLIAETIDFTLLLILKFTITCIAVQFYDFIDFAKYESYEQLDLKAVVELTSGLTFLEVAYRFIVCLYEGVFLRGGVQNQIGGATPGKAIMGIKVVLCSSIEEVENQPYVVKVVPATNLGFGWSFTRALLKNLVFALFLPIPYFFNKFNRTTYDILCHSIVVEDRVRTYRND